MDSTQPPEPLVDEAAPAWPDGSTLAALDVGAERVTLVWSAADDDIGVTRYHISRDGEVVAAAAGGASALLIEGLDPSRDYTFGVEAEDDVGNVSVGGPSVTIRTGDDEAPTWPGGSQLTVSNVSPTGLSLAWAAASDDVAVTSYILFQNGAEVAVLPGEITLLEVDELTPWTDYTFHVESEDAVGNRSTGGPSLEVMTTDEAPPVWSDDSHLSAVDVTASSLVLFWSPAGDDVGVKSYQILQDGAEIAQTGGEATSFFVDGLSPWTETTFRVEATDPAGNVTDKGPTVTVRTDDDVPPTWPVDKSLGADPVGATSLTLIWSAADDDVAVVAYRVFQGGDEVALVEDGGTTLEVTGLSPWSDYTFHVEAEDAAGNLSDGGPQTTVKTGDEIAPSWPQDAALSVVAASPEEVTVAWSQATDDVGVTGYRLFQGATEVAFVGDGSTTATVGGLSPWSDYVFRVEAEDAAANLSAGGPEIAVKTPDQIAPSWPVEATLTAADVTSDGLNLQWSVATDDVGVTLYRVYQDGVAISALADGSTTLSVAGLNAGTQYAFHVEAEDAAGNLSTGGPVAAATTLDDLKPTWPVEASLSAVSIAPTKVILTWSLGTDNVGVVRYRLYQDDEEVAVLEDGAAIAGVDDLSPGTEYLFRVEGEDAAGNLSEGGPTVQVQTTDESAPTWNEQATLTTSDVTSAGLILQWTAATDDVGVDAYHLYQDGVEVGTVDGTTTTYTVTGLSPWTDYVFRVEAVDAAGNLSQGGPEVAVMTLDEQAPTWAEEAKVTAWDVGSTSLLLWWSEAMDDVGVTGYRIYRDGMEMAVVGPETTAWPVTGLAPWTSYVFRVEAEDAAGNLSSDGPESAILTGDNEAPSWPDGATLETTEVTAETLVVTWPIASDDVGITGYRIYVDGEEHSELGGDQQVAVLSDLSPWTEYVVRVEALDEAGNLSQTGPAATLRTVDEVDPTWPLGSSVVVGDVTGSTISLNWTPAVDDVGVTSYQVSAGDAATVTVGAGTLGAQLTGLVSGATYPISVEALDGAGNLSTGGPTATVATPDVEAPVWPDGSAMEALELKPTTVSFSWVEANDNVGVVAYQVYRDGELVHTGEPESLEYKDWGLEPDTAYDYAVEAVDAAGLASADGPEATFQTQELLPPPDPATVAPIPDLKEMGTYADLVRFLFEGDPPIQTGVPPGAIRDAAIAVVHGGVFTPDGQPVSLVEVSIDGHPEFGKTLTRLDGEFDMAVNGGGEVLVRFKKPGVLPAQRLVQTSVKAWAAVEDVVMVPLDTNVTVIDLFASDELQVAQGNEVVDDDGARTATVMVPAGTGAEMVLGDGSIVPLTTVSLRATEYTVGDSGPAAMPADLPPTSAYTYAVELSVDEALQAGALEVRFDQALSFYLDNFLGLPVGVRVPSGYLDRQSGAWVPSLDGGVVEVLEINDGVATLDVGGEGFAATQEELDLAGVSEAELAKLGEMYEPGDTLWRIQMEHFTPWDFNFPYVPPENAIAPDVTTDDLGPEADKPDDDCEGTGSVIGITQRSLGEYIAIAGVPFSLSYRSTRAEGYEPTRTIRIPLSGEIVPPSLKRIDVRMTIARKRLTASFVPGPNQIGEILWDGRDGWGRVIPRPRQVARTVLSYVYDGEYAETRAEFQQGFSRIGGVPLCKNITPFKPTPPFCLELDRMRKEISLSQRLLLYPDQPGVTDIRPHGFGGWTVTENHQYSPDTGEVFLGDGGRFTGAGIGDTMERIAGVPGVASSDSGSLGDGGPATEAHLNYPQDMVIAGDGSIYIADTFNHRIRRIGIAGIITTVAGGGGPGGSSGDGGDALDAVLCYPMAVDVARDGSIYIVDAGSDRVRRVGPDGIITTVLGGPPVGEAPEVPPVCTYPESESEGDELLEIGGGIPIGGLGGGLLGPDEPAGLDGTFAADVELSHPVDVVVAPDGRFYVSDQGTEEVLHVGLDGVVELALGHPFGLCGFFTPCGVGTPGRDIAVNNVGSLSLDFEGNLTVMAGDEILTLGSDGRLKRSYHPDTFELLQPLLSSVGDASTALALTSITQGPDGFLYATVGDAYAEHDLAYLAASQGEAGFVLEPDSTVTEFIIRLTPDAVAYTEGGGSGQFGGGSIGSGAQKIASLVRVAGVGHSGSAGDGGFALQANLYRPLAPDFDPDGSLVFLDSHNHTIRRVSRTAQPGVPSGLANLPSFGAVLIPSPDGRTVFEFLETGRHLSTRDAVTGVVLMSFGYDDNGELVEVLDEQGQLTTIERNPFHQGSPTDLPGVLFVPADAIVGPYGHRTELKYDPYMYLETVTSPAGRVTTMTYDTGGLLLSLEDGEGGVTTFEYDDSGNLLSETDAAGGVKTLTRADNGDSVTYVLTSPSGRATSVSVSTHADGGLTRTTTTPTGAVSVSTVRADGSTLVVYPEGDSVETTVTADPIAGTRSPLPASRTTTQSDGETSVSSLERTLVPSVNGDGLFSLLQETVTVDGVNYNGAYEPADGVFTWLTPGGSTTTTQLDQAGRVSSYEDDNLSAVLSLGYGDSGDLTSLGYGGLDTTFVYGDNGRVEEVISPGGKSVHFTRDADDLLTGFEMPSGRSYGYIRDGNGRTTGFEMPNGDLYTVSYTPRGLPAVYTYADGAQSVTEWTVDGEVGNVSLASGKALLYTYDEGGRHEALTYDSVNVNFSWEGSTELLTGLSRVADGEAESYTYETQGGRPSVTVQSGAAGTDLIGYDYDSRGFLSQVSVDLESGSFISVDLVRDLDGRVIQEGAYSFVTTTSASKASGVTDGVMEALSQYDGVGRLVTRSVAVSQEVFYDAEYSFSVDDHLTQVIEDVNGIATLLEYVYDDDGQLLEVYRDEVLAAAYTYDLNGNRASRTVGGVGEVAIFEAGDRILNQGDTSYTVDADGFLDSRLRSGAPGPDTFTYTARGELLVAEIADQEVISYTYDAMARRLSRVASGELERYLYADISNLNRVTHVIRPDGELFALFYDDSGRIYAMENAADDEIYYVATDRLGSPRVVVDFDGEVKRVISYSAFGEVVSDSAPDFFMPIGFAGGIGDNVTGLVRMGARDYDPVSGRWMSPDPSGFAGSPLNLYMYAGNDPVGLRDASGEIVPLVILGAVAIGGVAGGAVDGAFSFFDGNRGADLARDIALGVFIGGVTSLILPGAGAVSRFATRVGSTTVSRGISRTVTENSVTSIVFNGALGGGFSRGLSTGFDDLGGLAVGGLNSALDGLFPGLVKNTLGKGAGGGFLGGGVKFAQEAAGKGATEGIGRFRENLGEFFGQDRPLEEIYKGLRPGKGGCGGR